MAGRKPKGDRKGFTLIEVLIVVAILGVLASMAIPYFTLVQSKARRAEMVMGLDGIYTAQIAYFTVNSSWQSVSCIPLSACQCPNHLDNFTMDGFAFSQTPVYYDFCLDLTSFVPDFMAEAVGNIDQDPANDIGQVFGDDRQIVIVSDDLLN